MVSPEALTRKQRFLKLKEEHGGIGGITHAIKQTPWNLWFNDDGDIISLSKEPNEELSKKFRHTIFTQDQIDIIKDKNWSLFRIKADPKSDKIFYIATRPIDAGVVTNSNQFLSLVKPASKRSKIYDIKVELTKNEFIVTGHSRLLSKYEGIAPINYTANGKKELVFHLTTINDPSFLLQTISIPLSVLIPNKQVAIKMESDMRQTSIYTLPSVDKYIRT